MCAAWCTKLAPAERSYTGKLGVKLNWNGPNEEKCLTSLNMCRRDWSTLLTEMIFSNLNVQCNSSFRMRNCVCVSKGHATCEKHTPLQPKPWFLHETVTWKLDKEIERKCGSSSAERKEREHLRPTHSVTLQDCAQSATKSTFWTFSKTSALMA